jgi:hypothetical protein
MGRSYGGRRSRVCIDARAARANMRTTPPTQHWRGLDRLIPKLVQKLIGEMGTRYGGLRVHSARSAQRAIWTVQTSRARTSAKCESIGMEQSVATAVSVKYEPNLRQTQVLERVIRRRRFFSNPRLTRLWYDLSAAECNILV